ncbi:MAG: type 1 glutamine amidotransferase [Cellvibrionaceae bacterium]
MKIGILQTGRAPDALLVEHGDYDELFKQLLSNRGFEFVTYPVLDGVFPESSDECDGWLITGSRFGVYEDHAWIEPLECFIRQTYDAAVPIIGVCFGHQILAQALGGKVEKFDGGWSCGAVIYDDVNADRPSQTVMAWHQDQVVQLPPDATVIGRTDFCAYAILSYGDRALSTQPHPEFSETFFRALLAEKGHVLPEETLRQASESLEGSRGENRLADMFERFFKRSR